MNKTTHGTLQDKNILTMNKS